ncbi:alpha/beta fold hydrolase [Streptomyces sp. NPDC059850]|uniref:alpha/beta fold hydrolase n=1 Tax=Streptomyces sp. NPDC059850 TaxID=3346970 RepID=UPI003663ABCF
MQPSNAFAWTRQELTVDGVALDVATAHRGGTRAPILFLHGFGSTKEDYTDIALRPAFDGHPVVAYDAPGCGDSVCGDLTALSIPFLVDTALAVLDRLGIERFHLVGHSMGGLTALMLASRHPGRVLSFVDIEGNVAPEDCFLSRQIVSHPAADDKAFLDGFIERNRRSPAHAAPLFASSLPHKVRAGAVRGIFESMVELSDHADLMATFLGLPFPRMFMYGDQNASLSYLPRLDAAGVELAEIPQCGHFPMYSNPPAMWARVAEFQGKVPDPWW